MNNTCTETAERAFAYQVRHALDERLNTLPESTSVRLKNARTLALTHQKTPSPIGILINQTVLSGPTDLFNDARSWFSRVGLVLPALILMLGLVGMYQFEQQQHIEEIADIDAAVLSDELPLAAYLDHGFNAYLTKRDEPF